MYYQPYSFNHEGSEYRPHTHLMDDVTKALNEEFQAIQYYTRLAELAPNAQFRQSILEIRQDEIKHFHWFTKSYKELFGHFAPLTLGVKLPVSFQKGVHDSIKDEQEAVPFYKSIASKISNPQIRQRFIRAANDEGRHAQIFSQISHSL